MKAEQIVVSPEQLRNLTKSEEDSFHYSWHPPENNLLRLSEL